MSTPKVQLLWHNAAAIEQVVATPEMFGAVGDGVTDDSGAFTNMFNSKKQFVVLSPGKTYFLKNPVYNVANATVNLNGSTIEVYGGLRLSDNCTVMNGTILESVSTWFSRPTVSVEGSNVIASNINFESKVSGCYYVKIRTASDGCRISNCHFDGNGQINILACGSNLTIEDCRFENCTSGCTYSNCVKLSADDCFDDTTPCARNTYIKNCYFGFQTDNCVDCFAGADGLTIESCIFDNGANVGIEIKNQYRAIGDADYEAGTSLADKRVCRNIFVNNCEFLGIGYMFVASVNVSANYSGTVEPVSNLRFTNCKMPNVDSTPFAIADSGFVNNVTVDNLILTGLTAERTVYVYGNNTVIKNIDNEKVHIVIYGKARIEKCKLSMITLARADVDAEILQCSDYGTGGSLIMANACASAVVHDCNVSSRAYLLGLSGSPTFLCLRNNIANNIINNGFATAGGKVYIINNLYKNVLKPSADNVNGIALDSGNVQIV